MSKNKSHLKAITLKSLIVVPQLTENSIVSVPVLNYKNKVENKILTIGVDIDRIKEKALQILDVNIKRLEKVRNRILESPMNKKGQLVSKIDSMLTFLKKEKPKAESLSSLKQLSDLNKEITKNAQKNDINLGKVFDGRKDTKTEKFYSKLGKKFEELERNINRFSIDRRDDIKRIVKKGHNLIEQLKNEDKKDKDKAETKKIRRELALVFNELKFLM